MANPVRRLEKGQLLFREGDPCDAMYVIKSGRIAITKAKGRDEIVLAEKNGGEMLGEMGFFDNRARSASARAVVESEIITLPFDTLHAQFKTFPDWLKAMVKTIIAQLREANSRIKNLEVAPASDDEVLPPSLASKLFAIIVLTGYRAGEPGAAGLDVPYGVLRDYCIQIFQLPTNRLDRLLEVLRDLGLAVLEDLGEGRRRVVLTNHRLLVEYTDWQNRHLHTEESKRTSITAKDLPALAALVHFGQRATPDARGMVRVNLTEMQNAAARELGRPFNVNDADPLVELGLAEEKRSGENGVLTMDFNFADLAKIWPFWRIYHAVNAARAK